MECSDWRAFVKRELAKEGIVAVSPMRHKKIKDVTKTMRDVGRGNIMTSPRGIVTRDRYDTTHCNVGLANLLGAKKVSIRTMVE